MPELLDGLLRYSLGPIAAVITALITWAIAQQSRKTTTEETAIDRLRSDLDKLRAESREEQAALAEELQKQSVELRLQADYVHNLREHIVLEKPPPPPPFPDGIYI